jgi:hypothetical protein
MKKILLIPILGLFYSCTTSEIEVKNQAPELYPTETCQLTWQGDGKLILIDKNHSVSDTVVNSSLNGSSEIQLIKRGYYELKIINSTTIFVNITNPAKEVVNFEGNTNGLTLQFFNK